MSNPFGHVTRFDYRPNDPRDLWENIIPLDPAAFIDGTRGQPLIPYDLHLPDSTDENSVYHGPWNLLAKAGVWTCSRHGRVEMACDSCGLEAAEHARTCGPSMACPWWRETLGWNEPPL